MYYLLLGIGALLIWVQAARLYTRANPATMAKVLRTGAGVGALGLAALLALRGAMAIAAPIAMLGSWLIWGPQRLPGGWGGGGSDAAGQPGATSRVVTDHLDVELDHTTGEVRGKVLKGMFRGRRLERLRPVDVALLWQDCRFNDPQSAQVLEAYLDRSHPTWREDLARGEREMGSGPDGRMNREEARQILGIGKDASAEEIRKAHRDLIMKLHPDRGGSTYLAAKINEAKDVLLGP